MKLKEIFNKEWIEAEGIRAFGISNNRDTRLTNATITEDDVLKNYSVQELIDSI